MTLLELKNRCDELLTLHSDESTVFVMDKNGEWFETDDIEGENTREITIGLKECGDK